MRRAILTYADYAALPDDGRRYELHDGELSVTPAPAPRHQRIAGNLYAMLRAHIESRRLGALLFAPVDCILSDTTVVQPDLVFVEAARTSRISERAIEGAPTLAIEVLSPSSETIDRRRKLDLYARHGIPYYWIVDPAARLIEAHALVGDRYGLAARLAEDEPGSFPPFGDLLIDPASVWS
jgi:Uma2 family endonuclease